jgi:hypothetical protein
MENLASSRKPMVMIGIPTIGMHSFAFSQAIQGAILPSNFSMQLRYLPFLEVGRARNIIVQEAVNVGAKYLIFLDEDVIFPANGLPTLVYHMETKPDITFVGGLYATKSVPPEPLVYTEWGAGAYYGWKAGEFIKVLFTGMGFSIIRLSDLDNIKTEEYQERDPWRSQPMMVRELFNTGNSAIATPTGLEKFGWTEDAAFFKKLAEVGLKSYVDTNLVCGHYENKQHIFFYPPIDNGTCVKPDPWNRTPCVVNLGAGHQHNSNQVTVDLRTDDPNITYHCDIRRLPNDWEKHFDIAIADNVLEHFDFKDSAEVLAEWYRILKPGGYLELNLPDMTSVAEAIVEGRWDASIQGSIYGDQGHPYWMQEPFGGTDEDTGRWLPHSFAYNHHNSGYTPVFIIKLLNDLGYEKVEVQRYPINHQMMVHAYRPEERIEEDETNDTGTTVTPGIDPTEG